MTVDAPEAAGAAVVAMRTRDIQRKPLGAIEAIRGSRKSLRAFRTVKRLPNAPESMGCIPGAMGTCATLKRRGQVEKPGQETIEAKKSRRDASRAVGSAKVTGTASDIDGEGVERMVQRAAHVASGSECDV